MHLAKEFFLSRKLLSIVQGVVILIHTVVQLRLDSINFEILLLDCLTAKRFFSV